MVGLGTGALAIVNAGGRGPSTISHTVTGKLGVTGARMAMIRDCPPTVPLGHAPLVTARTMTVPPGPSCVQAASGAGCATIGSAMSKLAHTISPVTRRFSMLLD